MSQRRRVLSGFCAVLVMVFVGWFLVEKFWADDDPGVGTVALVPEPDQNHFWGSSDSSGRDHSSLVESTASREDLSVIGVRTPAGSLTVGLARTLNGSESARYGYVG